MVKVDRPEILREKQLNCLRKVRPVNKGLRHRSTKNGRFSINSFTATVFCMPVSERWLTNTNVKKVTDNTYVKDRQEKQFT